MSISFYLKLHITIFLHIVTTYSTSYTSAYLKLLITPYGLVTSLCEITNPNTTTVITPACLPQNSTSHLSTHLKLHITPVGPSMQLSPVTLATNPFRLIILYGTLLVLHGTVPQAEEPLLICPAGHPHSPALHHQDRFCLVPHYHCLNSTHFLTGNFENYHQQNHKIHFKHPDVEQIKAKV